MGGAYGGGGVVVVVMGVVVAVVGGCSSLWVMGFRVKSSVLLGIKSLFLENCAEVNLNLKLQVYYA